MLEALWSVEFVSSVQGFGAGVVVLETQRILGGDAQYYYVGNYELANGKVKANIKVTHYSGSAISVFGPMIGSMKEFNLILEGEPHQETFELHGYVKEIPSLEIGTRLTRRAELP